MEAAPALGPATAPVTIVEYADFGCPACWEWHQLGILDQLRAKYGDQIRFVWRDFPVITCCRPKPPKRGNARTSRASSGNSTIWFTNVTARLKPAICKPMPPKIGLNMEQFNDCVTSRRYRDRVNAEQHEGFERGLKGAPAFFVNDQRVIGPQTLPPSSKRSSIRSWRPSSNASNGREGHRRPPQNT